MSIDHFAAAFNCKKFKNGARLLLLALANRASDGKPRKDGKVIEYGWSFAGTGRLMADINASSRDTVIDNMKSLVDAGVVKRNRRLSHSSLTFVDIDVLRSLAYTADDVEEFKKKADTKVGKSTTTGRGAREKALLLNGGKSTTTDVGEIQLSDVGNIPATAGGNFPTYNPKDEPQVSNAQVLQPSESESERADSDYDSAATAEQSSSLPTASKGQKDQDHPSDSETKDLLKPTDVGKGKPSPPSLQDDPDPGLKVHEDLIHLCSLWWSTHENPLDDIKTSPISEVHPWGHPRTWTPAQRREAFLAARQSDLNSQEPVLDDDSEPVPELEPNTDSAIKEEALLRDERHMLELYLKEGRGVVEDVLVWLPQSNFWFSKITSLAKLKSDFDAVFASHEKYLQKALDNGSDVDCEDFVYGVFLESGGAAADSIYYERIHPLPPVVPEDAAEEQAAHAFDDEYGVDLFDPWAPFDHDDAVTASHVTESSDAVFNAWAEADAGDPAGDSDTPRADESGEVDAEPEQAVARYCEGCCSVHAGGCTPDDYGDLE